MGFERVRLVDEAEEAQRRAEENEEEEERERLAKAAAAEAAAAASLDGQGHDGSTRRSSRRRRGPSNLVRVVFLWFGANLSSLLFVVVFEGMLLAHLSLVFVVMCLFGLVVVFEGRLCEGCGVKKGRHR